MAAADEANLARMVATAVFARLMADRLSTMRAVKPRQFEIPKSRSRSKIGKRPGFARRLAGRDLS